MVKSNSIRSTFTTEEEWEGDVFPAKVGAHSQKPELFYDLVEQLVDGPYCELFARRQRPGWTCLGDEM
jgi:N6-adenosine-specific RNA methylase IME4